MWVAVAVTVAVVTMVLGIELKASCMLDKSCSFGLCPQLSSLLILS